MDIFPLPRGIFSLVCLLSPVTMTVGSNYETNQNPWNWSKSSRLPLLRRLPSVPAVRSRLRLPHNTWLRPS